MIKSVGGTYDRSQQHSSLMQTPDGNRLSPTMTKLSDATAIAQQRLNAKNRIQRSLIDHQNGKLRGSNMVIDENRFKYSLNYILTSQLQNYHTIMVIFFPCK